MYFAIIHGSNFSVDSLITLLNPSRTLTKSDSSLEFNFLKFGFTSSSLAFFNIFLAIKYTYCIYGLVSPSNDIVSFKLNTISFSLGLFKQVNINAPIAIFLAASSLFTKLKFFSFIISKIFL